jgi:serine/threonine protein kinase
MPDPHDIIRLDAISTYRLDRLIGESTFGEIWAAQWLETQTPVAIKRVHRANMAQAPAELRPHWVNTLQREIDFLKDNRAPYIVGFRRHGLHDATPILVLEALDCNLHEHLTARPLTGPDKLAQALKWLNQLADGINVLHVEGLRHLDLKPHNLLLTADSAIGRNLKLADFGCSQHNGTRIHGFAGTPGWQAPEQFFPESRSEQGFRYATDHRADFYVLGLLFFYMICGQPTQFASHCCALHRRRPEHAAWEARSNGHGDFTPDDRSRFITALGANPADYEEATTWIPGLPPLPSRVDAVSTALDLLDSLLMADRDRRPPDADAVLGRIDDARTLCSHGSFFGSTR